ncbi:MAG: phosphoribosylanthranilate isomerase [Lachnospiraceae bacterium]|nr:phosphoribosylanthranilate isomerase [Lachnospiraceae bacterium]
MPLNTEHNRTKVKICGLSRREDILYVNEAMPDFCGFIINVPKSIRNTTPEQVRALRQMLRPEIIPVGVFRNALVETVAELLQEGTIAAAQLHGSEDETYIRRLKAMGNFTVIKAFNERTLELAQDSGADYILLDHGSGGTGQTFDWTLADKISRPYFLAGGLGPDNIIQALEKLHPWAVDLSSSVETEGKKDREKILAMVRAVRDYEERRQQSSAGV